MSQPSTVTVKRTGPPAGLRGAVSWSAVAVAGRQVSQMAFALVLARLLGPDSYGVVSAATVYVTFSTLVLDQGLAAAIIQRPTLEPRTAGAVATLNLITGLVVGGATIVLAPAVAAFFGDPALSPLLQVLSVGMLLKAAAITPRALGLRHHDFRAVAVADIAGGIAGAAAGVVAAFAGAGVWSLAWQALVTDVCIALLLAPVGRGNRPNRHLSAAWPLLPFSLRVFGSSALAFASRNGDNVLVGRFLGLASLSLYSMAYRVLVIPVQLIGQTVNRVVFPALSRLSHDRAAMADVTARTSQLLALAAVPPMFLVATAAPELVRLVLGERWAGAIPVLMVLAIAGARETVMQVTHSLMRATGRGALILRYEIAATAVQLLAIVVGLAGGVVGVAVGVTVAGFLLTPVLMAIQKRLVGLSYTGQLARVLPPVHASLWGVGAYLAVRALLGHDVLTLVGGGLAYGTAVVLVLRLAHGLRLPWPGDRQPRDAKEPAAQRHRADPAGPHPVGDIVVSVLTYRRVEDVVALVPQIAREAASLDERVRICVIDNDPAASAREAVAALALPGVRYVHEAEPGIAHARNRALSEAADAHLLVFIDDDERPCPGWLTALVDCYRATGAAAVAGAVVPDAERIQDAWVRAGEFFVRQRHATYSRQVAASTANLLLDLRQVAALGGPRFDVRFGTTGGSDTLFTRLLTKAGGEIVWCDEAKVTDHIRPSRLTRGWVLQRALRAGNSWSRTMVEVSPGGVLRLGTRLRYTVAGLARIVAGSARWLLGVLSWSARHRARGSRTAARGVGMLLGAYGIVYEEYRRSREEAP